MDLRDQAERLETLACQVFQDSECPERLVSLVMLDFQALLVCRVHEDFGELPAGLDLRATKVSNNLTTTGTTAIRKNAAALIPGCYIVLERQLDLSLSAVALEFSYV